MREEYPVVGTSGLVYTVVVGPDEVPERVMQAPPSSIVWVKHSRYRSPDGTILPRGGLTVVGIRIPTGFVFGWSVCSKADGFCKSHGISRAFLRAYEGLRSNEFIHGIDRIPVSSAPLWEGILPRWGTARTIPWLFDGDGVSLSLPLVRELANEIFSIDPYRDIARLGHWLRIHKGGRG